MTNKALNTIDQVLAASDSWLERAFSEIKRTLDDVFEALKRKVDPNGNLAPADGPSLGQANSSPSQRHEPMRIEAGTEGSGLNPSVARFLNLEDIQNLEVVYSQALQQNPKLAAEFAKVRGRSQTAAQNLARALENNDQTSLRQAERLSRDAAADAARLERKLVETGILRDSIRYKPEPELLGNNKHGLEWEGGLRRLAETGNPQGRFGSLADIQFAVDRAAELGAGREDFFDLLPGNYSFVYKYKDDIIGGEVITVPAGKVYVKVRNNGVVHAYPLE